MIIRPVALPWGRRPPCRGKRSGVGEISPGWRKRPSNKRPFEQAQFRSIRICFLPSMPWPRNAASDGWASDTASLGAPDLPPGGARP
jgi:hypothetical protein